MSKTKIEAIFTARCPKCREGRLFNNHWWQLKNFSIMNKNCPICGIRFEVEPGFFIGAMYVSYALFIAQMAIGGVLIYNLFNNPATLYYVIPLTLLGLVMAPFNFRMSRILYLHNVSGIDFDQNAIKKL